MISALDSLKIGPIFIKKENMNEVHGALCKAWLHYIAEAIMCTWSLQLCAHVIFSLIALPPPPNFFQNSFLGTWWQTDYYLLTWKPFWTDFNNNWGNKCFLHYGIINKAYFWSLGYLKINTSFILTYIPCQIAQHVQLL